MTTATIEKPTVESELAALRTEIIALRECRESDEIARLKRRIGSLEFSLDDAKQYCSECGDDLDDPADTITEDDIRELAKARTALMNGKCDEGRDMLERVLDRAVGDKWRLYT